MPAPTDPPTRDQIVANLLHAHRVAERTMQEGRHPFGAILVAPDHRTVLMEQGNLDTVNHAESTLARLAAERYDADYLWRCTLYTTVEPCCMCAGTAYWANIGRVVFGVTERALMAETGDHPENPTMDVPSRYVFDHCQKPVDLIGPVPEVADTLIGLHQGYWSSR